MVVINLEHLFWKSKRCFLDFKLHIIFSYRKSRSTLYVEIPHRITDTLKRQKQRTWSELSKVQQRIYIKQYHDCDEMVKP